MNEKLRNARNDRRWSIDEAARQIGISRTTYIRWEQEAQTPHGSTLNMICEVFKLTPEQLGFRKASPITETINLLHTPDVISTTDIIVRSGSNLVNTSVDPLDRLQRRTLQRPSNIDEATLSIFEMINKNNWRLYAAFDGSFVYRGDMLPSLIGHLQTITNLMEYSLPEKIQNRLAVLACDTLQIIGEVYFDLKDNPNSIKYYKASIAMAIAIRNDLLVAVGLGRLGFVYMYSGEPDKAISLLETACSKLKDNSADIIRTWLLTRKAEAIAMISANDRTGKDVCFQLLDEAEYYFERARPGEISFAFDNEGVDIHMNRSMLLGFKGACYTHLSLPEQARHALVQDLTLVENSHFDNHKAIVFVDLAKTYAQQGAIKEAHSNANKALMIANQVQSVRVIQRLNGMIAMLEPWQKTSYVKEIKEQMDDLQSSIILTQKGNT